MMTTRTGAGDCPAEVHPDQRSPRRPPYRETSPLPLRTIDTLDRLEEVAEYCSGFDEFVVDVETVGGREARNKKDKPALDPRTNKVWCIGLSPGFGRSIVIPCGHPDTRRRQLDIDTVSRSWLPSSSPVGSRSATTSALISVACPSTSAAPFHPLPTATPCSSVYAQREPSGCGPVLSTGFTGREISRLHLPRKARRPGVFGRFRSGRPLLPHRRHRDREATWKLSSALECKPRLARLLALDMDLSEVLMHMEQTGVHVDRAALEGLRPALTERQAELRAEIERMAG